MWLRYLTNGPEFDFPLFTDPPPVRYVLASTPRSGSNMLARALWHTGMAGFAEDYFADEYVLDYFERWGFADDDPGKLTESYVRKLMTVRTSPNGVFGVRVHSNQLRNLEGDLHDLWILDGTYLPRHGATRYSGRLDGPSDPDAANGRSGRAGSDRGRRSPGSAAEKAGERQRFRWASRPQGNSGSSSSYHKSSLPRVES
jgi:hypothetical protein